MSRLVNPEERKKRRLAILQRMLEFKEGKQALIMQTKSPESYLTAEIGALKWAIQELSQKGEDEKIQRHAL